MIFYLDLGVIPVTLDPSFGNQMGGTLVKITGPCFKPKNRVECIFGRISMPGIFISQECVACVSPVMDVIGRITMILEIKNTDGNITFQKSASFYSSE